jgi:lipopolysaccharide export system protein LptC
MTDDIQPPDDLGDDNSAQRLERFGKLSGRPQGQLDHNYTRRVRRLRLLLPIIALIIVGVVFAWPKMDQIKPEVVAATAPHKQTGSNELIKPKFMGQDSNNQPYTVTADSAVQSTEDPDAILLEQPRGHTALADGMTVEVQSAKGAYRQKAQRLTLENNVRLSNSQGYYLDGSRVTVDMITHKAWSDQPVQGAGPAGTIRATGLQADTTTGVLVFTGPATLTLNDAMKGF